MTEFCLMSSEDEADHFYGVLDRLPLPMHEAPWRDTPAAELRKQTALGHVSSRGSIVQLTSREPDAVMRAAARWLDDLGRMPVFASDNNGFDYSFLNWYFHHTTRRNPFGHSSHNLKDLYKGVSGSARADMRKLRRTRHTHHPVDDCRGNYEAFRQFAHRIGVDLGAVA